MSAEELLKPRFEVIRDYPNSPYEVGDIIEAKTKIHKIDGGFYYIFWCERKPRWCRETFGIEQLEKYPQIFRPLEWWEYRTLEQMPKNVVKSGNFVYEVQEWNLLNNTFQSNNRIYFFNFTPSIYKPIDKI